MQFELIRALRRMALNARRARESTLGVEILYICFALSKDANGEPPTRAVAGCPLAGDCVAKLFSCP